jgi:hypothetical protein
MFKEKNTKRPKLNADWEFFTPDSKEEEFGKVDIGKAF